MCQPQCQALYLLDNIDNVDAIYSSYFFFFRILFYFLSFFRPAPSDALWQWASRAWNKIFFQFFLFIFHFHFSSFTSSFWTRQFFWILYPICITFLWSQIIVMILSSMSTDESSTVESITDWWLQLLHFKVYLHIHIESMPGILRQQDPDHCW